MARCLSFQQNSTFLLGDYVSHLTWELFGMPQQELEEVPSELDVWDTWPANTVTVDLVGWVDQVFTFEVMIG